ncbi:MAG: hypothetical protein QOJ65_695 [Fimbriimonadaceae bacterium]|nr:hypothetical protein [Fimbriimonadaceae bacterium]
MEGYSIEIVPYDPSWAEAYEEERDRLSSVLKERVIKYEHMGSTSVPGLAAKPIIDISAAVRDLASVPELFTGLKPLGYEVRPQESADRYDLWCRPAAQRPTHILHFMEDGSDAWIRPIIFRNALRADPDLRRQYAELKLKLAQACRDDNPTYGRKKTAFIERVVDGVLARPGS